MSVKRVLVCGARDYADEDKIFAELDKLNRKNDLFIIEGGARGADTIARKWAKDWAIGHDRFDADWRRYGKPAGPIRNRRMLKEGKPDIVLAFGGKDGVGTNDMVKVAKKAGVEVKEFDR